MAAKKKKQSGEAIAVDFEDLRALFGLDEDDPKVGAVLDRSGKVVRRKPDGGARYVLAKQAGYDILVERPRDAKKRGALMVVTTIFLYCEGSSEHAQFAKPPYGLAFSTRTEVLEAMPKPDHSWKIGDGEVPLDSKGVDHDRWTIDGLHVSADYDEDERVRSIQIALPRA